MTIVEELGLPEKIILNILKQSSRGLKREEFLEKARVEGVEHPLQVFKKLENKNLARKDEKPSPLRFKATKKAFDEEYK